MIKMLSETLWYGLAAAAGWFIGRGWNEAGNPETVPVDISLPSLPPGLVGLKILHLSDLHGPNRGSLISPILTAARGAEPDLIVVTGDLARTPDELGLAETVLRGLSPRFGIYCVYGNNDLGFNPGLVRRTVEQTGAVLLDDAAVQRDIAGTPLRILGINHYTACSPRWRLVEAGNSAPFTLVLLHGPGGAASLDTGDLVLAGHTHGGQIMVPPFDGFLRDAFHLQTLSGLTAIGSRLVYINRGIGTKGLPLRFHCRPEITLITLRRS